MVSAHDPTVIKRLLAYILGFIFLFLLPTSVKAVGLVISNPIISNDEVTIKVNVTDINPSVSCTENKCYLQGMFTKPSPLSYFGYTQNNYGDWYKYNGSPLEEEILSTFFYFTPTDSSWSGQMKIKNDPADTDYKGPGDYVLKVKRYTGGSREAAQDSNDLTVALSYTIPTTETVTATQTQTSTPTPTATPTPTKTSTPTKKVTPKPTTTEVAEGTPSQENTVLGLRNGLTDTPTAGVAGETVEGKKLPLMAIILIAVGTLVMGGTGFAFIKKVREDKSSSNEGNNSGY